MIPPDGNRPPLTLLPFPKLDYRNLSTQQEADPMELKINKKPWQSKKWMMAALGFAVITAEVVSGINLPDDLLISQALLVLGYLGFQTVDDVKGRDDVNESKRLDLLGKSDPPSPA